AGKRRIPGAFALEHTLHVTQFGVLRKDDAFEVVLNPGTDKVEKQCLGPVPRPAGNTGWGSTAQPRKHTVTEPIDCTGVVRGSQFALVVRDVTRIAGAAVEGLLALLPFVAYLLVPVAKGLGRRDAHIRRGDHAVVSGQVFERQHLLSASHAEDRAPHQEQR